MTPLPVPAVDEAEAWVATHLGDLAGDEVRRSPRFRGDQVSADAALAALDVTGYARRRNEVLPRERRGASGLSPWIRHGLLPLGEVWAAVADGPPRDVAKYRDELAWQEYARHLYARVGRATGRALRHRPEPSAAWSGEPWDRSMACVSLCLDELEGDGWLVNQTRMWMASQWTVRAGAEWTEGEDRFFAHLLDGSRAANRLGWQWTVGAGTGRPYGFSRRQVRRRAPGLCDGCTHRDACPIEDWPTDPDLPPVDAEPALRRDPAAEGTAGPREPQGTGQPDAVWLTAESLGDRDPAVVAHPDLPRVFTFDEPLLARLRLSGKRLVFLAEALAGHAAAGAEVELHRGRPAEVLAGRAVAATFAPVPGWRRLAARVAPVAVHPWPWLVRPGSGPVTSFSAWRKGVGRIRPS